MSFLNKKRQFITSKLQFKPKQNISEILYPKKKNEDEEKIDDNADIQSIIGLQEDNQEQKVYKEFISEKDLKRGLNPQISYSKLSKIDPLPKEYKVYKKTHATEFEKKHLKKIAKQKKKLSISQKIEKWNFDSNYEKYQRLLTSIPDFNELPRISGV